MARVTGLEPATFGVTGRHSNQLSYTRAILSGQRLLGDAPLRQGLKAVNALNRLRGAFFAGFNPRAAKPVFRSAFSPLE